MAPDTPLRLLRERRTLKAMVHVYCKGHHTSSEPHCAECAALLEYALRRLDNCPFQDRKPVCNRCRVHCYSRAKQSQIKAVMAYAGPRMLYRHPILSLWHLLDGRRDAPELPAGKRRAG